MQLVWRNDPLDARRTTSRAARLAVDRHICHHCPLPQSRFLPGTPLALTAGGG